MTGKNPATLTRAGPYKISLWAYKASFIGLNMSTSEALEVFQEEHIARFEKSGFLKAQLDTLLCSLGHLYFRFKSESHLVFGCSFAALVTIIG